MPSKKYSSDRKRSRPVEKVTMKAQIKRNKLKFAFVLTILIVAIITGAYFTFLNSNEADKEIIIPEGSPIAIIDTSMGTIKVALENEKLPKTCKNFIDLANDGFYDGVIFHRVKDNFMIQAGRYMQNGEPKTSPYGNIDFETNDDVKHVNGAISMASTDAGVGGSAEFFICDGAQSSLDGKYAAFGVVIEGMDIVQAIAAVNHDGSLEPTPENPYLPGGGKPLVDIVINSIKIEYS